MLPPPVCFKMRKQDNYSTCRYRTCQIKNEDGHCCGVYACVYTSVCVQLFEWPFRSYISAGIVYVSRSSNTAIIPVWAGPTLWDLSATVWFNNMQVLSLTLILSSVLCLYLLACRSFSFFQTPLFSLDPAHTHTAHSELLQRAYRIRLLYFSYCQKVP